MTEQLRQQLTTLINTFVQRNNEVETCVNKIIELLQANPPIPPQVNEPHPRRRSIFDEPLPFPTSGQRGRSNTYNGQGLVKNANTAFYNNRDID